MDTTKKGEELEVTEVILEVPQTEITAENTTEFSLQVILEDKDDEIIQQEILEIAVQHALRSYNDNLFTSPSEKALRSFQNELMSKDISCDFIFKSPKPLNN